MPSFTETQVAFENGGQTLYGFLVLPGERDSFPAVALLDGFGGSSHGPRRMFTQLTRRLAADGIAALRFSFRGNGDSEGDFAEVSIGTEVSDARVALDFLRSQPGVDTRRVGLVGMSLGGLVASCVACDATHVPALVLWAAVAFNGERIEKDGTEAEYEQLRTQGSVDRGGYAVNMKFIEELRTTNGAELLREYRGQALILHGTGDAAVPVDDAHRYKEALGERAELALLEGADHRFSSLKWERDVLDRTVGFLHKQLLS